MRLRARAVKHYAEQVIFRATRVGLVVVNVDNWDLVAVAFFYDTL